MSQPYTHAQHAAKCAQSAQQGHVLARQPVQIVRRGVVYCARICGAWTTDSGLDCWTVETLFPESCRMTVPVKQVRECAGLDGRCACAAEDAKADRAELATHEDAGAAEKGASHG